MNNVSTKIRNAYDITKASLLNRIKDFNENATLKFDKIIGASFIIAGTALTPVNMVFKYIETPVAVVFSIVSIVCGLVVILKTNQDIKNQKPMEFVEHKDKSLTLANGIKIEAAYSLAKLGLTLSAGVTTLGGAGALFALLNSKNLTLGAKATMLFVSGFVIICGIQFMLERLADFQKISDAKNAANAGNKQR
jgi:hypothetical protein